MQIWRFKRQLISITFFAIIIILILVVAVVFINTRGNCFDGIQNRSEEGIDCGGKCEKICLIEPPQDPILLWARFFEIGDSIYDVAALYENRNQQLGAEAEYTIKLHDSSGVTLASKTGNFMFSPGDQVLIFEPNLFVAARHPEKAQVEVRIGEWSHVQELSIPLGVVRQEYNDDLVPTLITIVENQSYFEVRDVDMSAMLLDESGNVYAVSRTFIDKVDGSGRKEASFTWPDGSFNKFPSSVKFLFSKSL